MRLFTRYQNSAGQRIRIALALKDIDYEYVSITEMGLDAYRARNPQGLMPALEVEGKLFAQSTAIFEYLEEVHPETSLLSADPIDRGQARAIAHHIAADMHSVTVTRLRRRLAERHAQTEEMVADWVAHWAAEGFRALETNLMELAAPGAGGFCFGQRPTIADIFIVPHLQAMRRNKVDLAPYSRLLAVEAACMALPAFQAAMPECQPDFPG